MNESIIESIGVGFRHDEKFIIDRPDGLESYLFLHFLSDVEICTEKGIEIAKPGDCIIYSPRTPQKYYGKKCGLINDWFHAKSYLFSSILNEINLPVNVILNSLRSDFITPMMINISQEIFHKKLFYQDVVYLLTKQLMIELKRQLLETQSLKLTPRKIELLNKFRELRFTISQNICRNWTVSKMSEQINLSPSRFAVIYKEFFHISPIEDVLSIRLNRAKVLLKNYSLNTSDVCYQSGFKNLNYFCRIFKRKFGVSPGKYRVLSDSLLNT